jgi:hypothetical protein
MEKLFEKELIDEFQRHPLIEKALNGCCLMNTYDFLGWFTQTVQNKDGSDSEEMADLIYDMVIKHFRNIANSVCEKRVNPHYTIRAMRNILESSEFDVLVILAPNWEKLKLDENKVEPMKSLIRKRDHVLGLVIVEKGECKRMETTYSINLICTRSSKNLVYKTYSADIMNKLDRKRTKGGILLGAYLFCAKKYGQSHGILELAGAYKNIEGFFSYSKQGFVKDLTLFGGDCFLDFRNLPMSAELESLSYEKIIEHASGDKSLELKTEDIKDDTGFIRFVPKTERQKKIQKLMIPYCNLLYKSVFLHDEGNDLEVELEDDEIAINDQVEDIFSYSHDDTEKPELHDYHEHYRGMLRQHEIDFNIPEPRSKRRITRQLSFQPRISKSKKKTMKRARSV